MPEFLPQSVNAAVSNPWLQALAIALLAIPLAWLAKRLTAGVLVRLPGGSRLFADGRIATLLSLPVFVTVLLLGMSLAMLRVPVEDDLRELVHAAFQTVTVLVWLVAVLKVSAHVLRRLAAEPGPGGLVQPTTLPLLDYALKITLILAGVYLLFQAWGIQLTALLASAGLVGLALSFAARDTLANIFAGAAILADQPYKVGDYINLDTGERGMVTQIGIRSTRLLTRDDVEITIPNSIMGDAKIINESGGPHEKFRIRVQVDVAYGSDLDAVEAAMLRAATSDDGICRDPEPRVRFRRFGDSGLEFELLCWIAEPALKGRMEHRMNRAVYHAFNEDGVQIPFPQRDLHIRGWPAEAPPGTRDPDVGVQRADDARGD